jgi:hypothetical protein
MPGVGVQSTMMPQMWQQGAQPGMQAQWTPQQQQQMGQQQQMLMQQQVCRLTIQVHHPV